MSQDIFISSVSRPECDHGTCVAPGLEGPAVAARVPVTTAPRVTVGVADSSSSDFVVRLAYCHLSLV